ncbi:MAG TPA: GNAT family N-acetyltransferase, partial [Chloroflexota bacterium]|nr:GNAT family N-acetyltransferase [Chloroflexota bacterium]
WLTTWWPHFGQNNQLRIVTVRDAGRLVGLAPLMISRWEGFRHLGMIGTGLADYEDLIVADDAVRVSVISAILDALDADSSWDFLQMNRFRDDSPNLPLVRALTFNRGGYRCINAPFSVAPYIPIVQSWSEYWKSLSSSLRRGTERRSRRLQEEFHSIEYRAPTSLEEVDHYADTLIRLNVSRHRDVLGFWSVVQEEPHAAFHRDLARCLFQNGHLDFPSLVVDGTIAALQLNARYNGVYYGILPAFDSHFARFSVGRMLQLKVIQRSFEEGFSEFTMLEGDEAYKFELTGHLRKLLSFSAFRYEVRGAVAHLWFGGIRERLRHSARTRRLIPWLRRHGLLEHMS